LLELAGVAGKVCADERRRQVADGHRGEPPLRLRRFARIADNERIDERQRATNRFREARRGERHGLARQPFQRAVRAHVNHGVEIVLQPEAERHQGMARRQGRIVVVGAAAAGAAAIGREGDGDVAEGYCAETERAVLHIGIRFGLAPRRRHGFPDL
jgi:hypothetical protein